MDNVDNVSVKYLHNETQWKLEDLLAWTNLENEITQLKSSRNLT